MKLALAEGLSLPGDAATQVYAMLGRRGSGKTYGASRLVEQAFKHGDQVVVLDPVGVWWGLRLDADGKTPGLDVTIFGGSHGDIPLQATAGKVVAELVAERATSLVLDVSEFTMADQRRFVADFALELFHAKKRHRSPVLLVLEEAQEFVPQHVRGDVAKMVGALERLVKLGRNYGVGVALISQRPQAVNKDVLNLTEVLCAFQLVGPQERKTIQGWVAEKGAEGRDELGDTLPSLPVGTAMIWSPQWLRHFGTHRFLPRETYDASATPKGGRARPAVKLAPIDLAAVQEAMSATIEQAKQNDPAALRAEVARLRRELEAAKKATPPPPKPIEVPVVLKDDLVELQEVAARLQGLAATLARRPIPAAPARARVVASREPRVAAKAAAAGDRELSRCARALLAVLAQRGAPTTDAQLSILSGYSIKSSSFANGLGELRSAGLAAGPRDAILITAEGAAAGAGLLPPVPTDPAELLDYWQRHLGRAERTMLGALFARGELSREELAAETGYSITSSSFANAIGKLRSLELATGSNPIHIAATFREVEIS